MKARLVLESEEVEEWGMLKLRFELSEGGEITMQGEVTGWADDGHLMKILETLLERFLKGGG